MPTLPITSGASVMTVDSQYTGMPVGVGGYFDSGAIAPCLTIVPLVNSNANNVYIAKSGDTTHITSTSPITWANGDAWYIKFNYEF